jgi:integrase
VKDHALGKLALARVTAVKVEERLREMERDGLGPNSINHLRRVLLGIFRRATKAGLWYGPNPIEAVETRREHERAYATLKPHQVPVFLAHVPDQWRDVFATALYLGLRKGEIFALKKSGVDLRSRIATIQRSYLRATTKGGHVDTLPIPPQLVPNLEHALAASGSEYMFPGPDGGMRSKDNDLARLTQVVCKRAGLVEGYDHSCRRCKRNGKPYVERRPDACKRWCPQCGMQLLVTVIPRPMRFHDTRHTYGTLLAQGGFDGVRLQRAMRHRDFKMTARYVHTNVEDLRGVGACLPPAALEPAPTPPPATAITPQPPAAPPSIGLPPPAPPPTAPPFDSAPLRGATLRAYGKSELAAALAAGLLQVSGKGKKKGPGPLKNSQENPAPCTGAPWRI